MENLRDLLSRLGTQGSSTEAWLWVLLEAAGVTLAAYLAHLLARKLIVQSLSRVAVRTRTNWDDIFVRHHVFNKLAHFAPALIVYYFAPAILVRSPIILGWVNNLLALYVIAFSLLFIDAAINALLEIYDGYPVSHEVPLKGVSQIIKIILYFVAIILVISILLDKTPLYFLSGLGALTAVLLLIFKDAILGFVAGIHLAANRMVARGDWIEMPKYGADGDVLDVSLATVKVQNWDKSISTIPTYALISESFRNWRGMQQAGGRRIKRAIYIDMNTITFCTEEMLARLSRIAYIREYLEKKQQELSDHNIREKLDLSVLANGRRLTNVGTFRAYVSAYLHNHPMVRQDLTFLIRHLQPTDRGLPIEIYVFCKDTRWPFFEAIQADIFDHILAVVPQFGLRVFQVPAGSDIMALKKPAG